jgi:protein N-terminal methyltransferase
MGCWWSDPYRDFAEVNPDDVFRYYGKNFYSIGRRYWSTEATSLDGMLGDLNWTHTPDINFSRKVLERYIPQITPGLCADVGCGIGRISITLLSNYFQRIDLVDPIPKFLTKAESDLASSGVVVRKFACGAQDWVIEDRYDCFWVQWVLMFLTDTDCIALLTRCRDHLTESGIVVVKENTVISNIRSHALWCPLDHSISRTLPHQRELFVKAGFRVDLAQEQPEWSDDLIPLYCFVLRPQGR